jgi:hypothetical protein
MRYFTLTQLVGLLLLGCSMEHTIADEKAADQSMFTVIARPVCVEMCNHALACGEIADAELADCQSQCERNCVILEGNEYVVADQPTGQFLNAADVIAEAASCDLEGCGPHAPYCGPEYLAALAKTYSTPPNPVHAGTLGMTSCGMQDNQLECQSKLAQGIDPNNFTWTLTCQRESVTATVWTCECFENGVQVAENTGVPEQDNVDMTGLCWSRERLACFYANQTGC